MSGKRRGKSDKLPAEQEAEERPPETEGAAGEPVVRVWDLPDDKLDPPSQQPEDTHQERKRRRRADSGAGGVRRPNVA